MSILEFVFTVDRATPKKNFLLRPNRKKRQVAIVIYLGVEEDEVGREMRRETEQGGREMRRRRPSKPFLTYPESLDV